MKIKIISLLLTVITFTACENISKSENYYNEVYFNRGIIHSVDRDVVSLSDGSVWKVDRILTAVNMSPAMVVIRQSLDEGFMYIDGVKYRIIMQIPDIERISFYPEGSLDLLQSIEKGKSAITLFGGAKFYIRPQDIPMLESWGAGPDVIITEERNTIINPRTFESIPVVEIPAPADEQIKK